MISAVHVHLPYHQRLLTVVVGGEAEKITKLVNDIEKLKGIEVMKRALIIPV
ncbi:MAG: hypothetical protein DRJ63_06975 [Thermoprotei archaeon]|nr:MAG: hypothetical protein DRJ63_06975 [Thermoprotei archaeon]